MSLENIKNCQAYCQVMTNCDDGKNLASNETSDQKEFNSISCNYQCIKILELPKQELMKNLCSDSNRSNQCYPKFVLHMKEVNACLANQFKQSASHDCATYFNSCTAPYL